jgi:hypothetical protein
MRKIRSLVLAAALAAVSALAVPSTAHAATGDVGVRDQTFGWTAAKGADPNLGPTASKPQSKLWSNDGTWWGVLYAASGGFHIQRLDNATQQWVDTGTVVDGRKSSHADVLWDGSKLSIATAGPSSTTSGDSARFLQYTYNSAAKSYTMDTGFPVTITTNGLEAIVLAKDTTGKFWVTFTQGSKVYVNHSTTGASTWGSPFVLPVATGAANLAADDISSIIAFKSRIGVLWSNQNDQKMYFAVHADGNADTTWSPSVAAFSGTGAADDHINLKELESDAAGDVFAVIKTSKNDLSTAKATDPLLVVLVLRSTGAWQSAVFATVGDDDTRPILQIDDQNRQLYVFATTNNGDPTSWIIYKKTGLDTISFPSGQGTPFIKLASDTNLNNATSTKQNVNNTTGLVVLASDLTTGFYAHNKLALGGTTPPPTTMSVIASADARVEEATPSTNFGAAATLRTDLGPEVRSYLRFAVTGIAGKTITSAKLRLWVTNPTTNGPAVQATGASWTETGITWTNKPAAVGAASDDKTSVAANAWVEYNVAPLLTNGDGTYNMVLTGQSTDGMDWNSREGTNKPTLVISTG